VAKLGDVAGCGATHEAGVDCTRRSAADGVPEILVSALGGDANAANPDQGRVYVLDGRTGAIHRRLRLSDLDMPPTGHPAEFGYAIASAGDLDGNGEPEAVVGAPGYDETFDTVAPDCEEAPGAGAGTCEDSGRVYVFPSAQLGGPAPSGQPSSDFTAPKDVLYNPVPQQDAGQPPSVGERFGETISAFGNAGLLIGAPLVDVDAAPDAGVAFLVDGVTGGFQRVDPPDPQTGGRFGSGVFSPPAFGNVDGSASPEVIVGAPSLSGGQGRAYLVDGDTGAPPALLRWFDSPAPVADARFGTSMVRVAGDMPTIASPFGSRPGVLHIFNPNGPLAQTVCDPDGQAGAGFGAALATLGDTNGDGFDDLAVGAPGFDLPGAVNGGRVYILTSKGPAATGSPGECVATGAGSTGGGGGDAGGGDEATPPDDGTVVIARVLRRLSLTTNRKRVRKDATIRLRGRLSASGNRSVCQKRQKIALQRRRASGGRFQTFEVALTRRTGRFTARAIAERTFVYRARVSQTARCMGAVSKTAKVSILRKRGSR
jgi:hypothetical protein